MSRHGARIVWRAEGDFSANAYRRAHAWHFDGGAVVPASASPAVVRPPLSDPAGVDPEEALIAAVSSCHMLWFLSLAQGAGVAVRSYEDAAEGEMGRIGPGRMAITTIVLRPAIVFDGAAPDRATLDRLHADAHARCFIANSIRSEVRIEPPDA